MGYCTPYSKSALRAFAGVPRRRLRVAHPMLASSKDANWKKERMVVRRKLRVRTLALRFVSRSARNALMKGAKGHGRRGRDGAAPVQTCTTAGTSPVGF